MSVVFKGFTYESPEEAMDENLEPVSDEEFKEIYDEVIKAYEEAYNEAPDPEIDPEMEKILETEDMVERAKLYERYCEKRGKLIACE